MVFNDELADYGGRKIINLPCIMTNMKRDNNQQWSICSHEHCACAEKESERERERGEASIQAIDECFLLPMTAQMTCTCSGFLGVAFEWSTS